jgi:hypothetical protein
MADRDVAEEYREYVARFEKLAGRANIGAPAKWRGRLVTKLNYPEFEARLIELRRFQRIYTESMERGDTVNDVVLKLLRDRSAELLIEGDIL